MHCFNQLKMLRCMGACNNIKSINYMYASDEREEQRRRENTRKDNALTTTHTHAHTRARMQNARTRDIRRLLGLIEILTVLLVSLSVCSMETWHTMTQNAYSRNTAYEYDGLYPPQPSLYCMQYAVWATHKYTTAYLSNEPIFIRHSIFRFNRFSPTQVDIAVFESSDDRIEPL